MEKLNVFYALKASVTVLLLSICPVRADIIASTSTDPTHSLGSLFTSVMEQEHSALRSVSLQRMRALGSSFDHVQLDQLLPTTGQEQNGLRLVIPTPRPAYSAAHFGHGQDQSYQAPYTVAEIDAMDSATGGTDWSCMTEALYFEARGESVAGQFAVAEVILNRVDDPNFPNTICDVVNQGTGRRFGCQFTYTCDGQTETVADHVIHDRLGRIARIMIDGGTRELTSGATHYHANWVSPSWALDFSQTAEIGQHVFYRIP